MNDTELIEGWQASGLSRKKYAQSIGVSESTVANAKERQKKYTTGLFTVDLGAPLALSGDWMIIGDIHVPCTDYDLALKVVKVARKAKISRLLIAGDLFNLDGFSKYLAIISPPSFDVEVKAAAHLFKVWLEWFDEIKFLPGNHDYRLPKYTRGAFDMEKLSVLVSSSGKVTTSNFAWCTIDTPEGVWRVTHPANYRRNPMSVANEIARNCNQNVWSFHEHHLGISFADNGRSVIVNGGGLFDPAKIAYAVLEDSTSPRMVPGFGFLKRGCPMLFGRAPFTNWDGWV